MKLYKNVITLIKNNRGCYILDTVKGCPAGNLYDGKGCYGNCYAKNIADRYGYDFLKVQVRKFDNDTNQLYLFDFKDKSHTNKIIQEIKKADMPFIRIGEMGDPSVAWEHTLNVCNEIAPGGKKIVIITKHWKPIPDNLLPTVKKLDLCINTSVSALDSEEDVEYRVDEFQRLKKVCNSVLRIVSCEFNKDNADGLDRHLIQEELFKLTPHIDTVFRPDKNNYFIQHNIIKTKRVRFLRADVLASVRNPKTYFGRCETCPELCGVGPGMKDGVLL